MPRDSSGTMTRTNGVFTGDTVWSDQAGSADDTISAPRHDTHDQDMAVEMTDSLSRSGKGPMLANLDMNNNRILQVADATGPTDAPAYQQVVPYGTPAAGEAVTTGTIDIPGGSDAQRPAAPTKGEFRYNDNGTLEYWNGFSTWATLVGSNIQTTFTVDVTISNPGNEARMFLDRDINISGPGIGRLVFRGRNASNAEVEYGRISAFQQGVTAGSENGRITFSTIQSGSQTNVLELRTGIYTPNATGGDPGPDNINAKDYQIDGNSIKPQLAKAWVNFNASSGSVVIRDSHNISSVTRNSLGDFTFNFSTNFANANYVAIIQHKQSLAGGSRGFVEHPQTTAPTVSAYRATTVDNNGGLIDPEYVYAVFHGDQ